MAHLAKYTRGSIGNLTRHYERAKSEKTGEYIKFSNQDIDVNRICENYNLAPERNQLEFIKQRCDEVHCLKRKDVNVMCSWVVTLPKNFDKEKERKFFEECYNFLKDRYGGEKNVISAYVHKDEITPHLHYSFVPVIFDSKKNRETVSAKIMLNRSDLQTFHKDLENHLFKVFGYEVGILNEATKDGNLAVEELKRKSATERLEVVKRNIEQSKNNLKESEKESAEIIEKAKKKEKEINLKLKEMKKEYNSLKLLLKKVKYSDEIENKKSFMGKVKIDEKEYKNLLDLSKKGILLEHVEEELKEMSNKYNELKKKSGLGVSERLKLNQKIIDLEEKNNNLIIEFMEDNNNLKNNLNEIIGYLKNRGILEDFQEYYAKKQLLEERYINHNFDGMEL